MSEIPPDPDLLTMRRAVNRLRLLNDPPMWEYLGIPLAETLAKMEGSFLGGEPVEIPEAQRYVAQNIDEAIRSFHLVRAVHGTNGVRP